MIVLIRVDERLIHGEIVYSWKNAVRYDSLVVVSDEVAGNEMRKTALRIGCPQDVKVAIRSVADAIKMLNDPRLSKYRTMVLCEDTVTALKVYEGIAERPEFNVGYMKPREGRQELTKGVHVTREEAEAIRRVKDMGVKINLQRVPTAPAASYEKAVEKLNF